MRKLRVFENISLDGVLQHSADENNFSYSNWTGPYRSPAGLEMLLAKYGESFDMLLGRRTYDMWTGFWPKAPGPMAERINAAKKYIVTHHPETLEWGPCEGIGPDLVQAVRRLKSQDGLDIVLAGSTTLTSTVLANGLADELVLTVYPVLLGTGKRIFTEGTPAHSFELISTQTTPTGVLLNQYKVVGPISKS